MLLCSLPRVRLRFLTELYIVLVGVREMQQEPTTGRGVRRLVERRGDVCQTEATALLRRLWEVC